MDIQIIKELALANGFSLKEQASGNMDLHSYVYEFANAIEQAAKASVVEGFVLVPKEPTKDTLIEIASVCIGDDFANLNEARNLYKAAIKEAIEAREVS